ncbi:MAG: type II secretion system secretin GspD [Nitrospinota bacterium]|nr:type II secretion system secretin GspD [Nitrospinota bacterium]
MKKPILTLILASLILAPACALQKKQTAVEQLKSQFEKDTLERMKFSLSPSQKMENQDAQKKSDPKKKQIGIEEDLKSLKNIPDSPKVKNVIVTAKETTLRKGPGTRFKKAGMAYKDDSFALLRITQNSKQDQTWYLVQDKKGKKFFISGLFSGIKVTSNISKETIKKRRASTLEKLQTLVNPTPPLPPDLAKAKHITLNFEDTDINDVITTFSELLKIDYIIEGSVSGKVTLQTFNKIPVRDLYSVLEQILALHNVTVVKSGNFYRFLPVTNAVKKPLSILYGTDAQVPPHERLVIQIIPLRHISVESMKKIISPLLTKNASFIEIPETNNLMMIELGSNTKRILKVVEALDIDKLASSDIELYSIKHTNADLLTDELNEIFSTLGFEDAIGDSLNFLPLNRLNSILVVNAFKSILPTIEFWIAKLDKPMVERQISTFVYYVQNGEATKLAQLLNAIFKDEKKEKRSKAARANTLLRKKPKTASASEKGKAAQAAGAKKGTKRPKLMVKGGVEEKLEGELAIIADKDTNSLIIRTNPRNYPPIVELLKKLDLMPKQVFIEVLILDLTLDKQVQSGLEWALEGKVENATFGTGSDTGSSLGGGLSSATSIFANPGFSFFLGNANKLKALLQAFALDSKANVLSNPILITSNNKSASISITDEIPIQSTTITTPTAGQPLTQSTIEFRSVGIKLAIEPKINSENFVNLKVQQEISSPGAVIQGTTSFNVRSLNTEVVVKDNQVLVMGGLMQSLSSEANSGVPGLKDLPFFGRLFRSETATTNKTELMIFIVPHVVNNVFDADSATAQIKDRLFNLKKAFRLNDN